jgi:hypothetical protein
VKWFRRLFGKSDPGASERASRGTAARETGPTAATPLTAHQLPPLQREPIVHHDQHWVAVPLPDWMSLEYYVELLSSPRTGNEPVHTREARFMDVEPRLDIFELRYRDHIFVLEQVYDGYPPERVSASTREDLYVGLTWVGITLDRPNPLRQRQQFGAAFPDPWAADGYARTLSRFVAAIVNEHESGAVLCWANRAYVSHEDFDTSEGSLSNEKIRPWRMWTEFGRVLIDQRLTWGSTGMWTYGLPDIRIALSATPSDEEIDRAHAALLHAGTRMVFENRILEDGEPLAVAFDFDFDEYGISNPRDGSEPWRVSKHDPETGLLWLERSPA